MPIFDHFDFLAPLCETFIRPKDPQELWALADLPVSGALLDAGGGTGRVAQFMRGRANPIVVADLSYRMLSQARQMSGLHPVCSHTERLPFPDKAFARIIVVDALHHVCNQRGTVDELWRTLQPRGRLVIEEPDVRTLAAKLVALGEKLALMRSHFLSPLEIADLLHYSDARVSVKTGEFSSWIIAEKQNTSEGMALKLDKSPFDPCSERNQRTSPDRQLAIWLAVYGTEPVIRCSSAPAGVELGLSVYARRRSSSAPAWSPSAALPEDQRPWRLLWYQDGPYAAYYHTARYQDVVNLANTTLISVDKPVLEETYYWRGMAKAALGDQAGALEDLRLAYTLNPNSTPAGAELQRITSSVP